ncbi:MAG: hypothetical protein QGF07_03920, partial [Phycisphaerales bacterium]|nr:hypothetical protein [Phycisphaerales bacterium]
MKSPEISLSFRTLATAQCGATIIAAALWWCGTFLGGYEMQIAVAGAAESGILLIVSLIFLAL